MSPPRTWCRCARCIGATGQGSREPPPADLPGTPCASRYGTRLVDLRALYVKESRLLTPDDYAGCQALGAALCAADRASTEVVEVFRQHT